MEATNRCSHEILLLGPHGGFALAPPVLTLVEGDGVPFDVPVLGDGDHHVFFGDHVFEGDFTGRFDDFRPAGVPELLFDFGRVHL